MICQIEKCRHKAIVGLVISNHGMLMMLRHPNKFFIKIPVCELHRKLLCIPILNPVTIKKSMMAFDPKQWHKKQLTIDNTDLEGHWLADL